MKAKSPLAIKLIELRKELGVSSEEVANAVGLKGATYRRYEIDTMPKSETYIALAEYFSVSVDYLMGNTPSTLKLNAPNTFNSNIDIGELSEVEAMVIKKLRSISRDDLIDVSQYLAKKQSLD